MTLTPAGSGWPGQYYQPSAQKKPIHLLGLTMLPANNVRSWDPSGWTDEMSDTQQEPLLPATARAPTTPTTPPHPLDGTWFMRVEGKEYGPYTGHDLKKFAGDGRLEPDTDIRRATSSEWLSADTDITIRKLFPSGPAPVPPIRRDPPHASAGDRSTVVQVTNTIQTPALPLEPGADKSPGVALLLSLLFVGLGQIYNGDVGKGIMMFFGCILLWLIFLGWIVNIWSMIDAYSRAKELRERHRAYTAARTAMI